MHVVNKSLFYFYFFTHLLFSVCTDVWYSQYVCPPPPAPFLVIQKGLLYRGNAHLRETLSRWTHKVRVGLTSIQERDTYSEGWTHKHSREGHICIVRVGLTNIQERDTYSEGWTHKHSREGHI